MSALTKEQRQTLIEIEEKLRGLLQGEFSSLSISFNEMNGPNYQTVAQAVADNAAERDWISEEQKARAAETNRWWDIQWYPSTPIGFNDYSGASLVDVIEAALSHKD